MFKLMMYFLQKYGMELNSNKYIINRKLSWNKMHSKNTIKLKLKSVLYWILDVLAVIQKNILLFTVNRSIVEVKGPKKHTWNWNNLQKYRFSCDYWAYKISLIFCFCCKTSWSASFPTLLDTVKTSKQRESFNRQEIQLCSFKQTYETN